MDVRRNGDGRRRARSDAGRFSTQKGAEKKRPVSSSHTHASQPNAASNDACNAKHTTRQLQKLGNFGIKSRIQYDTGNSNMGSC